jgi:hypothetical protein
MDVVIPFTIPALVDSHDDDDDEGLGKDPFSTIVMMGATATDSSSLKSSSNTSSSSAPQSKKRSSSSRSSSKRDPGRNSGNSAMAEKMLAMLPVDLRLASTYVPAVACLARASLLILFMSRCV